MTGLDKIDQTGVALITMVGTILGLMIATASDTTLRTAVLFPGLLPCFVAPKTLGLRTGIIVCGLANGAIYGLLWHAWLRLVNVLTARIPRWSKLVAVWLVGRSR